MKLHQNEDTWLPQAEIGTRIPPYKPTYNFDSFINERHRLLSACSIQNDVIVDLGIPGWLRREDALKLYEMAYFAEYDILELGCYQGLSTHILAQAIKDSDDRKRIVSIDNVANNVASASKNLKTRALGSYVKFVLGDGAKFCQRLIGENKRFGFVFIDHSHKYKDVVDICILLPGLLIEGGFCLFHDFNDRRNNDPLNSEYEVSQAVFDSLYLDLFEFFGGYGCSALYRKRTSK